MHTRGEGDLSIVKSNFCCLSKNFNNKISLDKY